VTLVPPQVPDLLVHLGYSGGYAYSPYGELRSAGTATAVSINPIRYIGEHHDGDGIHKLGARYYDPAQGRFAQMDPSGQEANAYLYASGNPTNFSDPTGLEGVSQDCLRQAALLFGAGATVIFSIAQPYALVATVPLAYGAFAGEDNDGNYFQCDQ
jgi:RHS repeat-associated protein